MKIKLTSEIAKDILENGSESEKAMLRQIAWLIQKGDKTPNGRAAKEVRQIAIECDVHPATVKAWFSKYEIRNLSYNAPVTAKPLVGQGGRAFTYTGWAYYPATIEYSR